MKIYLMTDLEGVAGVINAKDWLCAGARCYDTACEFLTMEVNAAVRAFFEEGATEVVVSDAHGGGAVNIKLLDSRAKYLRGWYYPAYPFTLDQSYDILAYVGQHAKAGTPFAHLPHTQCHTVLDCKINGLSIGEFGEFVLCASELGIPCVFASGDKALCQEAEAMLPGVVTAAVKEGLRPDHGNDCPCEDYFEFTKTAIHLQPEAARELIYQQSKKAMKVYQQHKSNPEFGIAKLEKPYTKVCILRRTKDNPQRRIAVTHHPDSIIGVLNEPCDYKPASTFGADIYDADNYK